MSQKDVFVIETDYTIRYTNRDPVPIPEIIEALKNLEKVIKRTPKMLESIYDGVEIQGVEVYVNQIESGSLYEKFRLKYVFKDEAAYNHAKTKIDEAIHAAKDGVEVNAFTLMVAFTVGALVSYGLLKAEDDKSGIKNHIQGHHNVVIQSAKDVKIDGEKLQKLLDEQVDKKQLAKSAVAVVKPAKLDPSAQIEFVGIDDLTISSDVIKQAPETFTPPMPDKKDEEYTNARIVVFASDRDNNATGWAGIVPGVVDNRVNFKLTDGLDPKKIHGHLDLKADITVSSKFNKQRNRYVVYEVTINKTN